MATIGPCPFRPNRFPVTLRPSPAPTRSRHCCLDQESLNLTPRLTHRSAARSTSSETRDRARECARDAATKGAKSTAHFGSELRPHSKEETKIRGLARKKGKLYGDLKTEALPGRATRQQPAARQHPGLHPRRAAGSVGALGRAIRTSALHPFCVLGTLEQTHCTSDSPHPTQHI